MKPNFALSLSYDGLRLMHRVTGGWHMVGEVALDDADLTGTLERLRGAAEGLEPGGISTKVLIPNDQIKYLALDTTRAEHDDVREALHGATPYAVDDLVYDYVKGGGRTYVAAVAKETLNEAEQFAAEYGFKPVCFAAVPEPFTFVGEAFFGAVNGFDVVRDEESVVVIGDANIVIAVPEPVEDSIPEPVPEIEPQIEQLADAAVEPISEVDGAADDSKAETVEDAPVADVATNASDEPEPAEPAGVANAPDPNEETAPDVDAPADEIVDEEQPAVKAIDAETHDAPQDAPQDAPPMFASLRADRTEGRPAAPAPVAKSAPTREEPTFRRQSPEALAVPTGKGTDPMPPLSAPSRTAQSAPLAPLAAPMTSQAPNTDVAPPITGEAATALSSDAVLASASLNALPDDPHAPDAAEKPSAATAALSAASAVSGAVGGMFASRRMARAEAKSKAPDLADADTSAAKSEEKSKMTVFGARKPPKKKEKTVAGGKPRFLGLILTAVLLLFLLAIAAFAALSDENFARWLGFGASDTQIATTETAGPTAASEVAAPLSTDAPELATADDALAAPTAPTGGQVLTPEEATRIYAATGVWQRAPRIPLTPRTTTLDGMVLASSVIPVVRVPASPLASAGSVAGDALIPTPVDPPPPSQTFDFDAEGLVVATPQGAVTPDGILVIVGRPPLNPPTRPGTIAPEITPQDQLAAVIPEAAEPVADAPEGVIVIAGRPAIEPPVRIGTAVPAPIPEAAALGAGDAPLLAADGLLVLAGSPPVLPPARTGTLAPSTAPAPDAPSPAAPVEDVIEPVPDPIVPDALGPVAPEGLNIIAGPPPVLPPVRPGTVAPQASVESLTQDIAAALATSTAQSPNADTRRPLVRPAAVVQAAVAVANAPAVGELTATQAAAFRPQTRPAGLAPAPAPTPDPEPEIAVAAPEPAAPVGLQIAPEIAAAVQAAANRPNPIVNATAQAVPQSSRPDPRPRNMARIVERAAAAQQRAVTQVAAAPVAPRSVTPSGPTGGSVAQAATLDHAINLRDVNLIGIYGGSGDRRALVRMGNGRYVRVTVGDRLDGGRVTAISAGALSYTKSGRSLTLQVPG